MNPQILKSMKQAIEEMGLPKKAFVPGPQVQGQLQRLQAMAAEQDTDAQAAQMASEQAAAQGQGAPPAMRIEDLAGMIDQGFQQIIGAIQSLPQQIMQMMQMTQANAAQVAAPAAAGGGKPKKDDAVAQKLDVMIQMLAAAGLPMPPPPGAMPGAMPPAPGMAPPPPGGDPAAMQQPPMQ